MAGTLPDLVCCPNPCDSPDIVAVPGPQGDDGNTGASGADGINAFTTFSAQFTMPAELGSDTATVVTNRWMALNEIVYAAKADGTVVGYFQVTAIGGSPFTSITLKNLKNTGSSLYLANSAPGSIFPVSSKLCASGLQGPVGTFAGTAAGGDLKGTYVNPRISVANTLGSIPIGDGTNTTAFPAGTDGHLISYLAIAGNGVKSSKLLPLTADTLVADNRIPRLDRPAGTEVPSPLQSSAISINDAGAIRADGSGGNTRGTDAVDLQVNRSAVGQVASGNRSVIVGGEKNSALGTECVVVGGDTNVAGAGGGSNDHAAVVGGNDNTASGDGSFVGGGDTNAATGQESTVPGGNHNTASGLQSTVGGGDSNTASGEESTIAGGHGHITSDLGATVGGGESNFATAPVSTVPGGYLATANKYGQLSTAAGGFSNVPASAQQSILVMRNNTTGATATELFLDGASLRCTIPSSTSWMFQIMLVARKDDGLTSIYKSEGLITNVGGTVTMPAAATTTEIYDGITLPATPVVVTADDPNNALIITCTGVAATNVRWVARISLVEVLY